MRIPILDLGDEVRAHWAEFMGAAEAVLKSGQFVLGENVQAFEAEMAAYLGVAHAVSCNSATDALIIGLRAIGVGPGDEVLTSPFTFFATAEAVSLVGATPVFVDIDRGSYCLDAAQLEARITSRTRAIIPVHLFGRAAEMKPILALAQKRGLKVLEDVAQALGSETAQGKLGALGDLAAYSFFPTKNLGAFGDGGLMTTSDPDIADKMRLLRVHGSRKRYFHEAFGYNSRLDELQAAFLRVKLKYLDKANEGRRQAARRYSEILSGVEEVVTPTEPKDATHVFHQYTIRVPATKRDAVFGKLHEAGVGAMIYYPVPLHRLPVYGTLPHAPLPESEKAATEVLSLPLWPTISPETQFEVVAALKSALSAP